METREGERRMIDWKSMSDVQVAAITIALDEFIDVFGEGWIEEKFLDEIEAIVFASAAEFEERRLIEEDYVTRMEDDEDER